MAFDLAHVWAGLIAFAVLAYVTLDGMDLGIGVLFPFIPDREERDTMMNSVAPVWDGNETWLVLGGGGLFAAFPLAYAVLAPAIYPVLIAMLLGLIFRGVAFEFRFRAESRVGVVFWSWSFALGSVAAAFAQGVIVGAIVQGIEVEGRAYAGGWFDWLTPLTVFTGLALVAGYALLGAGWLILKTAGPLQGKVFALLPYPLFATLGGLGALSLWMLIGHPEVVERWFGWPQAAFTLAVPVLAGAAALGLVREWRARADRWIYPLGLALFFLAFVGLGISLYPALIPPAITIERAAAPDASLGFLLVGAAVLLPLILAYTAYAYWVFRGKVRPGEGYH